MKYETFLVFIRKPARVDEQEKVPYSGILQKFQEE